MGMHSEIATRLNGSSDLYEHTGRLPSASINFITAHDGFTLHDLVSYDGKHNEANGENNNDGANDNESWNCGAEGPSDDPEIRVLRERQKRNFLATLMLSQGVPMLCSGDEIGRTQGGNNNGYCQDNEISWIDWNLDEDRKALLEFTSRLIHYRRNHPNFHRRSFFEEDPAVAQQGQSIRWIRSDGEPMGDGDWAEGGWMRTLGMLLMGDAPEIRNSLGRRVKDNDYLLLLNSHHEAVDFRLPKDVKRKHWFYSFDTADQDLRVREKRVTSGVVTLAPRSLILIGHAR
jgi:glycogen operon protein